MSGSAAAPTVIPSNPPSGTALRARAALVWLGWTMLYFLLCAATLIVTIRSPFGSTPWWGLVVAAIWAGTAYFFGMIYRGKWWYLGPVAAGIIPPLTAAVMGIIGLAIIPREPFQESGLPYVMLAGFVGVVFVGVPALISSVAAALGVRAGLRRAALRPAAAPVPSPLAAAAGPGPDAGAPDAAAVNGPASGEPSSRATLETLLASPMPGNPGPPPLAQPVGGRRDRR